ncbi:poly-gamma-glutamate hydrolase family protein [Intestinibacter sp.]|uniref:poly-gamma-glutamate hydrolase family protein n=1 Tax=Intestinibacter sp. TaxID=1965304 RepID=UPI003F17C1D0
MVDKYKNYDELSKNEVQNIDYKITVKDVNSKTTCISIHGGNIEPGTSEIAEEITGDIYNLYKFEGLKNSKNIMLHITSSNFDDPKADELVAKSEKVISIHGAKGNKPVTYIGGLDKTLGKKVAKHLTKKGFKVAKPHAGIDGTTKNNIVNRGLSKAGCQLEITLAQRQLFFKDGNLKNFNRRNKTALFFEYVNCIREALSEY